MTTVLKLGGSVITDKSREETVDDRSLDRVAAAIGDAADSRLVLVHGAGSFGHTYASAYNVTTTNGTRDPAAIRAIHDSMKRLNVAVLDALADYDVPAVPVHTLSAAVRDAESNLTLLTEQIETMIEEGFVPVLHGDVIAHAGSGATIVSGDELVVELATQLSATRVGLCSTVPGVLDADDRVIFEIADYATVADVLGESDSPDVTGGMAGKVRALLALDADAWIFGLDDVPAFLDGEATGTVIR